MDHGTGYVRFMKKTRGQKSRETIPLSNNFDFNTIIKELFVFKCDSPVYLPPGSFDSPVYSPPGSFDSRGVFNTG
jgi:hypothetical protein